MKEDMEAQMTRVAQGIMAERALITHFKMQALEDALQAARRTLQACGAVGYVLHGGYARFSRAFPACCEPEGGYVPEE